jgi:hypothetical protein
VAEDVRRLGHSEARSRQESYAVGLTATSKHANLYYYVTFTEIENEGVDACYRTYSVVHGFFSISQIWDKRVSAILHSCFHEHAATTFIARGTRTSRFRLVLQPLQPSSHVMREGVRLWLGQRR